MEKNLKDIIKKTYQTKDFQIDPTGYFYDLGTIGDNILALKHCMPKQISLYYAMKANNNSDILQYIVNQEYIKGFEIASAGELVTASKFIPTSQLIFTGPGKTEYELEQAILNKIRFIHIESVVEAIRIQKIAERFNIKKVDILIRINLNYSLAEGTEHMSGCSTKMGIDENDYFKSVIIISKLDRICIKGIHVFAASGVLDYQALLRSNRYIFDLVKRIEEQSNQVEVIDFGGGIGIDYTNNNQIFDIEAYGEGLKKLIANYGFQKKEIIMELGTYLVGNAGYYTAKIIDIKQTKNYKHIILAGGVNHMGLPLEMRRKHPVEIIKMGMLPYYSSQPNIRNEFVDISGPLCMVTDKLCWNEYIKEADIGDIVVFKQSGAYCFGEGMQFFLSHMLPKEIIIQKGEMFQ